MKHLVILGAGSGGTMVANRMARRLPRDWSVTAVDPGETHLYQPGLLFLPFGARDEAKMTKPRARTLARGVRWVRGTTQRIDRERRRVEIAGADGLGRAGHVDAGDRGAPDTSETIPYDLLVIASGAELRWQETPGLAEGRAERTHIHDFYTLEGAQALRDALASFTGGRLVLNVVEYPFKCPVAPMEFLFLADEYFTRRGIRDRVHLTYATPLDGAFTKPMCNRVLGYLIEQKSIRLETEFNACEIDSAARVIKSYDDREVPYDLLVSIPVHGGAPFVEASGLGNELGFIPTHPHTLQAKGHDGIFVVGDATDLPSSKAGSVAHFQSEVLEENILRAVAGRAPEEGYDGHTNCFIETGFHKAMLIDFNYDTEPLAGKFPWAGIGPLDLLRESRLNHLGKLAFRPLYWNALLPGRDLPISTRMSMAGKTRVAPALPGGRRGAEDAAA
jgi:sulfide:quinone oxidoreductase